MIQNIGCDIVSIKRLTNTLNNTNSFIKRVYSKSEIDEYHKRNNDIHYLATRFAAKEAGIEGLDEILNGTTALALSDDHVTAAKIIGEFAEKHDNFKIKGGIMEGAAISIAEVEKLAKMPNREQLLCMLLYALNGNISGLARALQAIADQKNEATPA